jgi:hypothetical protein
MRLPRLGGIHLGMESWVAVGCDRGKSGTLSCYFNHSKLWKLQGPAVSVKKMLEHFMTTLNTFSAYPTTRPSAYGTATSPAPKQIPCIHI